MHIHLPKPLHGWREFLGEVGIIVIGVLIALGAEQLIEQVHQGRLRVEAQEAINAEINRNLDTLRRRAEVQRCIDARLGEVEALLTTTPLDAALPRPLWIGRPQVWNVSETRLNAATSGARTALLSGEQQAAYGEVYSGFRVLDEAQRIEQLAWARLRGLETLPALDAQSRSRLIEALQEAKYANFRILVAGMQTRAIAGAMGLSGARSPYEAGSRSVCIPLNTARQDALRLTAAGRTAIAEP